MDTENTFDSLVEGINAQNEEAELSQGEEMEGIHEKENPEYAKYYESMTEEMKQLYEIVSGMADEDIFFHDEILSNIYDTVANINGGGKDDNITPAKTSILKPNDLTKIDQKYTMGSLLVYWELEAIKNIVAKLVKGGGGGGLAKVNSMSLVDPKSIGETGKALVEFAKGCILMALVPKGAVTKATQLLVDLFDILNENSKNIKNSLKIIKDLQKFTESFKDVAKNLIVTSLLMVLLIPILVIAIPGVLLLSVFILVIGLVSKLAEIFNGSLVELTKTFLILSITFLIASLAIMLMAYVIAPIVPQAIVGVIAVIALLLLGVILGAIALLGNSAGLFIAIGVAFLIVSLGFILAAIALRIAAGIKAEEALNAVLGVILVMIAAVVLGIIAAFGLIFFTVLVVAGLLLVVGFITLFLALTFLFLIASVFDFSKLLPAMLCIILLVSTLALGVPIFIVGIVAALLLTIFSVLFFASMLLLFLGLVFLTLIMSFDVLQPNEDGENPAIMAIYTLVSNIAFMLPIIIVGVMAIIPLLAFSALFTVTMVLLLAGVAAFSKVADIVPTAEKAEETSKKIRACIFTTLLSLLGVDPNAGPVAMALGIAKGMAVLLLMTGIAVAMIPFVTSTMIVFKGMETIINSILSMEKAVDKISPDTLVKIFEVMSTLLNAMTESAKAFTDMSKETIVAVGELMNNVASSISLLTDVVLRLKDGIPDEQITAATTSIKKIVEGLFGNPKQKAKEGEYNLCMLFETLADSDLGDLTTEGIAALTPIMESLDRLIDLVKKTSSLDPTEVDIGIQSISKVAGLLSSIGELCSGLVNGGGLFSSSPLESIQELQEKQGFESIISIIDKMNELVTEHFGNFDINSAEPFLSFIKDVPNYNFIANVDTMLSAFKKFGDIKDKVWDSVERVIEILSNPKTDKLGQTIEFLDNFGKLAPKMNSVANAMNNVASAFDRMARNKKDLIEIFEKAAASSGGLSSVAAKLGGAISNVFGSSEESKGTNTMVMTNNRQPQYQELLEILRDWNENGVPIRGQYDTESKVISPDDVGNTPSKS